MNHTRFLIGALCLLAASLVPVAARAQIEDNLSSYTGENGVGYMEPLKNAIGTALNDAAYMSAHIPRAGFRARLSVHAMLVSFGDDDRVFQARTEGYFPSDAMVEAPTIVGDEDAVVYTDPGSGAAFAFPGGFNLDRFGLAVPQLTIGSVAGTEAMIRWIAVDTGDAEIGDVSLFGIGVRHSVSQYFPGLPVDVAAMIFIQNLQIGEDDLVDAQAQTYGVQASKAISILEPYVGFSMDSFDMDVNYESDTGGESTNINLDFNRETTAHLTLGSALKLMFLHAHAELNVASQTSFAFGVGLGN
jgi:hypothetical protein